MRREAKTVSILYPCGDQVDASFMMSLVAMLEQTYRQPPESLARLNVHSVRSSILPQARQRLATSALEAEATHTLWLDSDMQFPADTLLRFLRRDEAIVGINACSRRAPFKNCAQHADGRRVTTTDESSGLEKVARMGFGVLWVASAVFSGMSEPYFDFTYSPSEKDFLGEDFYFFDKANALGFEAYVDHDLSKEVFHMGIHGFNALHLARVAE